MASNTTRLNLLKKNPSTDGNTNFNIETMLNENWQKIDDKVATIGTDGKVEPGQLPDDLVTVEDLNSAGSTIQGEIDNLEQTLTAHQADYVTHTGWAIATGASNAYIATLTPALSKYQEGVSLRLKINVDNTGASTVNVNELGAKAIKKANGTDVTSGNLKSGSVYTIVYNGTNFILQGEGGELSDADLLTFINDVNTLTKM